jgi:hypothetical protein
VPHEEKEKKVHVTRRRASKDISLFCTIEVKSIVRLVPLDRIAKTRSRSNISRLFPVGSSVVLPVIAGFLLSLQFNKIRICISPPSIARVKGSEAHQTASSFEALQRI